MATRGWQDMTADQVKGLGRQPVKLQKASKYRNVKVVVGGMTFDSKREAAKYHELKIREKAGEIKDLALQVGFPLLAPTRTEVEHNDLPVIVSMYVADFTFVEVATGKRVVMDSKGKRTALYALKAKWLFLQDGIEIQEV